MSKSAHNKFVFKKVNSFHEKQRALYFMETVAQNLYKCSPPPPPQIIFVAKHKNKIVGTIALDHKNKQGLLPLEEIYKIDFDRAPFLFQRELTIQFGRWMTITKNVSIRLFYVAALHAIDDGKTHGLFEAKQPIADYMKKLGFDLRQIDGTKLIIEKIPSAGRKYYQSKPKPKVYMIVLNQIVKTMETKLKE